MYYEGDRKLINVLLVTDWDKDVFRFSEVARGLRNLGVRARIGHDVDPGPKHWLWSLGIETKVISMLPLKKFLPKWAEIWQQKHYDKIQEYELLERAGIPVPKWVPVYKGQNPNLSKLGEYVVVKPSLGGRGAFVRVMRRDRVSYRPIATDAMAGKVSPALIAQDYIHTGAWPINYRVGTVFGEPIYMFRSMAEANRLPFFGSSFDANFFAGRSIVATAQGCSRDGEIPEDVIDLAKQAHQAFPDVPLLGVDIVRDIMTKQLFVLEVNACGRTYQLAREESERNLNHFGLDLYGQFGGIQAVVRGIYRKLLTHENVKIQKKIYPAEERKPKICAEL